MNNKSDSALTNETLWQLFNIWFCFCFHCYHKLRFVEKNHPHSTNSEILYLFYSGFKTFCNFVFELV